MPIDPDLPFQPLSIGVLTLSDTRTEADDTSGDLLASLADEAGHTVARRAIIPDDQTTIEHTLVARAEDPSNYIGSALGAGDFNGDGFSDITMGAYGFDSERGRAYIKITEGF